MSSTHLSSEPGLPNLPPLAQIDGDDTTSTPLPSLPATQIGGPSNNVPTTADTFLSPPMTMTHPFDG
jgi:hypothetical protein